MKTSISTLVVLAGSTLAASSDYLYGVNIGSWLVLEKWMTSTPFDGVDSSQAWDEYTLCQTLGSEQCQTTLEAHWGGDWFNEGVMQELAESGINAVRIPIGWWAFDTGDVSPYVPGAADWLDKAIEWARARGVKVWVDLHGAPGSQNGFDNSGRSMDANKIEWQDGGNIQRTIEVLKVMAAKYGTEGYADVVQGIELINEPISWGANKFDTTYQFAVDGYAAVRQASANSRLQIVMHDAFNGLESWKNYADTTGAGGPEASLVGLDTHMYQCFVDEDKGLNVDEHVQKACSTWGDSLRSSKSNAKTYVGEWSGATNICVENDGSTLGGEVCYTEGCQCQVNTDRQWWNDNMKNAVRRYMEAQLDAFEENADGFFFWAFKGPGAWSWTDGVKEGWIPQPLEDRKFPNQCGYSQKRGIHARRLQRAA